MLRISAEIHAAIPIAFGIHHGPMSLLKMIDNLFNSFTCHAVPGLL